MADIVIYKRPDEQVLYEYDFSVKLPSDTALDPLSTVTAKDSAGNDVPSVDPALDPVLDTPSISGLTLSCLLIDGLEGEDYTITYQALGADTASVREWVVELRVRENLVGTV